MFSSSHSFLETHIFLNVSKDAKIDPLEGREENNPVSTGPFHSTLLNLQVVIGAKQKKNTGIKVGED